MNAKLPGRAGPVTAVLVNWQRPQNLSRIVPSLLEHDFIREVIVWNNAEVPLAGLLPYASERSPRVRVIDAETNVGTYGRFCAARQASYPVIYTQDDDYLIHNVGRLYERFLAHPNRITAGLSDGHYRAEAHRTQWLQLGWGSFFLRQWAARLDDWIRQWGVDELLIRKADRIFTTLVGRHDPQPGCFERLTGPDGRPSDCDRHALWRRADHVQLTRAAVARAQQLKQELGRRAPRSLSRNDAAGLPPTAAADTPHTAGGRS